MYQRFSNVKEDDAVRLQNLLDGRPSIVEFDGEDDARRIIQLYQEAYTSVMVKLEKLEKITSVDLLDKYFFNVGEYEPTKNAPEKDKNTNQKMQQRFLYGLVMMILYACLGVDCSRYIQDPTNLEDDFKMILEKGWINSKDDRPAQSSNEATSGGAYALFVFSFAPQLCFERFL